jgi:hypothetical protein
MELQDFIEQTIEEFKTRLHRTLDDLTPEELRWRPDPEANSIAFLAWHITRIEDRWTQRFGRDSVEVWIRDDWYQKFGLLEGDIGVRYSRDALAGFPVITAQDLHGYADAVRIETLAYLRGLEPRDFDAAPGRAPFSDLAGGSRSFGEDFTIGRMYRQLINEAYQHLGQVGYVRGLQRGLDK